jgi:hypothetical protein
LHSVTTANPEQQDFKQKIASLLLAARYLRMPLVLLNFLTVFIEMLFG